MLLMALVFYLHYEAPEDEKNFAMIMEMLRAGEVREDDDSYQSPLDELFERLEMRSPDPVSYTHLLSGGGPSRAKGNRPQKCGGPGGLSLIHISARHGCFISDLNLTPFLRRAALSDLCGMDENGYPLSQWQDAVRYLTGDERDFASVKEIQAFIKQDMEAEG